MEILRYQLIHLIDLILILGILFYDIYIIFSIKLMVNKNWVQLLDIILKKMILLDGILFLNYLGQ